ncbi:hypothetical protein MMC29_002863 [Sticta canariensis]|nr:hypothetical protein [Sticta canariensis]
MAMRIRLPFAGRYSTALTATFILLLLVAAYVGLTSVQIPQINDRVLHFLTFFLLTITFYWILDTTRRRTLNLTLLIVTFGLGLGSEIVQGLLPNDRIFDSLDIAANLIGSLTAVGLCTLYHKRMLDRRRRKKGYGVVTQQDAEGGEDLELGEGGGGSSGQENGVVEEAWDDMGGEASTEGEGRLTPSSAGVADDAADMKK